MEWIDANTYFGTWHLRELDVPPEELVKLLKEAGTTRALTLSLSGPLLEAAEGNDLTRLACIQHRDLIPFGTVDPRVYTGGEAVKRLVDLGAAAVRLTNGMNGYPLDTSTVAVVLKECAEQDMTAFVDVTGAGQMTLIERLAERAECRVAMLGMHQALLSEAVVCLKRCAYLYLETSRLNTPDGVRILCREVGPDRVMFGSGAPFNYASCARRVAEHQDLDEEELAWVASKTVKSLLVKEASA